MAATQKPRRLILSRHPLNHTAIIPGDATVLTPNAVLARELGVPHLTLDDFARDILASARMAVVSEATCLRFLRESFTTVTDLPDPGGYARSALSSVSLLYRSDVNLTAVAAGGSERASLVASVAIDLRQRLWNLGLVSSADAAGAAAQAAPPRRLLAAVGYARLGETEVALLDSAAGAGSVVILPYSAGSALFEGTTRTVSWLKSRGWQVEITEDAPTTPGQRCADAFLGLGVSPEGAVLSFPTPRHEVRGVLAHIKHSIVEGDYGPGEVTLITRSESVYGPLVREAAWEYGIPVVTHDSESVGDTRLGQALRDIIDVSSSGEFSFETVARLLHSPLCNGLSPEGWLKSSRWDEARATHPGSTAAWRDLDIDTARLSWPDEASRGEWATLLSGTLRGLLSPSNYAGSPQDLIAFDRLSDTITEMSAPAAERLSRAEFADQVRDALSYVSVPAALSRAGIQLHTPLAIFGSSASRMFVLGSSEGMLPRTIRDESFLDFHDRRILQASGLAFVETAAQAARREALSFYSLLLAAAGPPTFTFPRSNGAAPMEPSPLVLRLGLPYEDRGADSGIAASGLDLARYALAGRTVPATPLAARARRARDIQDRRERSIQDEHSGVTGHSIDVDGLTLSPSQITKFGQCPFAWFAAYVLRAKEPEEAADDLNGALRGTLSHSALRLAASRALNATDQRAAIDAALPASVNEAAAQLPETARLPAWAARQDELVGVLREAVRGEWFLKDGSRIVAVEVPFERRWNGLRVRGRIDRIDELADHLIVIDYKSSSSRPTGAKDADGTLKLDVQLPMYMAMASTDDNLDRDVTRGYYYSLSSAKPLPGRYGLSDGRGRDTTPPYVELRELAERMATSLAAGSFPVAPDDAQDACRHCDHDWLCRRGPHLMRPTEGGE